MGLRAAASDDRGRPRDLGRGLRRRRVGLGRPGPPGGRESRPAAAAPGSNWWSAARAYVSDESGWSNVWVAAADGTSPRPLLAEEREHAEPGWGPRQRSFAWAPDASALAINRNEDGFGRLVAVRRDGGATVELSRG